MSVKISSFISNIIIYTRRFDTTLVSSSGVFQTLVILTTFLVAMLKNTKLRKMHALENLGL